jgi:hypothetical protein
MLKILLSGRATGTPLFLAWSLVTLIIFFLSTLHQNAWPLSNLRLFLCGFLLLYVCQGILLVSGWERRALWVSVYVLHVIPPVGTVKFSESYFPFVHTIHGLVLLGARRRTWAWLGLAVILYPNITNAWMYFAVIHSHVMASSSHWVPRHLIPPYFIWYPFGVQILFGAIAAFFMPPIRKPAREQHVEG